MKNIFKKIIIFILNTESKIILKKYKPQIIAVTGSVGKTSTKDIIFYILQDHFYAYKSQKSYNSEIGVPLTIIMGETGWNNPIIWIKNIIKGLALIVLKNHYPKLLVLEMGVDRPKDMKKLTKLINPDIAVFTKFNKIPPHVEFFKNKEELYNEKWILARSVKEGGYIIANGDDENLKPFLETVKDRNLITYGFSDDVDIKASHWRIKYTNDKYKNPIGITFKLDTDNNSLPVTILNTIGIGYIYSALAAISCAKALNINFVSATQNLEKFTPPPGRMRLIKGIKNSVIIDDSYNSSPDALIFSLKVIKDIETTGKKIVVIGDMLELGHHAIDAHKEIGKHLDRTISHLYLIGQRAKYIVEEKKGGLRSSQIHFFNDPVSASEDLQKKIGEGDLIFVKGSQGIRLEKLIEKIMANPEEKDKLLVRQEKEWENR